MFTMYALISTIWIIISLKHISNPAKRCIEDFISRTKNLFREIDDLALNLYSGSASLKISSGPTFPKAWIAFDTLLFERLEKLDLISTLESQVKLLPGKMIYNPF